MKKGEVNNNKQYILLKIIINKLMVNIIIVIYKLMGINDYLL